MIGRGSDGNIEHNQIIALLSSAVILPYILYLAWMFIMNHNPCLGKIAQLFITIFVIICQAHLECIVNLANGFESLLLFRGIQRSHLRMSVRWMAEIIYLIIRWMAKIIYLIILLWWWLKAKILTRRMVIWDDWWWRQWWPFKTTEYWLLSKVWTISQLWWRWSQKYWKC